MNLVEIFRAGEQPLNNQAASFMESAATEAGFVERNLRSSARTVTAAGQQVMLVPTDAGLLALAGVIDAWSLTEAAVGLSPRRFSWIRQVGNLVPLTRQLTRLVRPAFEGGRAEFPVAVAVFQKILDDLIATRLYLTGYARTLRPQ